MPIPPPDNKKNSLAARFYLLVGRRVREWSEVNPFPTMRIFTAVLFLVACIPQAWTQEITRWPLSATSPAGEITVYQPQIESFSGNQFTAHSAVSVAQSTGEPVFGAIFFTASLLTDRDAGTVSVESVNITKAVFPATPGFAPFEVNQAISNAISQWDITLSQDQLLAQLAVTEQQEKASANLDNTPPNIIFETQPSVLVTIDGEPKLVQAPNSNIMTVVNTPFFLALDPDTKTYYLHGAGEWLSSPNVLNGPWTPATNVPDAVSALAESHQDPSGTDTAADGGETPLVVVATQPTELIQTTGPAEYGPIDGTNLLYVTNTESDVFMDIDTQTLFVLLSGRWYSAASQSGPWTYVAANALPADFARIPAGSPKASVLASVAGTEPANNAALDAAIPQTAAIQRTAPGPDVTYDGDPKFEPVASDSSVSYAVNTTHSVVEVDDAYYVCSDGVWYQGPAAVGPWTVSVEIPEVIYTIPPTCPIYPVTFCTIYSHTPDVVVCGYLPGYVGSYVCNGAVVYGTGWRYNPWFGTYFIPRPVTWGFGASFHVGWGTWGFAVGGGWRVGAFAAGWNSGWWGWSNYHWNNWNWNRGWNQNLTINRNVTRNVNRTVINHNIYRNHPDRLTADERDRLQYNEQNLAGQERRDENQLDRDRGNQEDSAQRQVDRDQMQRDENREQRDQNRLSGNALGDADGNDVFADGDGSVYRHTGDGWQQRQDNEWRDAGNDDDLRQRREDLNRQFGARARGDVRERSFGGGGVRRSGGGGRRR